MAAPPHPLTQATDLSLPLLWHQGAPLSYQQFLSSAVALAERLPHTGQIINLCTSPQRFLLGFAAALIRGLPSLMPPNRLPSTLTFLLNKHPDCAVLVDQDDERQMAQACSAPWLHLSDADLAIGTSGTSGTSVPMIAGEQLAAVLYTSGSTGEPQPIRKPWHTLVQGAHANAKASLAWGTQAAGRPAMVGTVPSQHSYGLETLVMLPLQGYASLCSQRPFYPQDIAHALQSLPAPRVLVTTPVHLRALTESDLRLPALQAIWSATAPLSMELATRTEQRFASVVHEIFGCTEVGTCATRRTTGHAAWRLLDEFHLTVHDSEGHATLQADHVVDACPLQDRIELVDDRHFQLLGRGTDLINIAGKRASLADLNHKLLGIAGVTDGVIFLPDQTADDPTTQRTAALVVAPQLSREQLLDALRMCIEPAFMPRPLLKVNALPRNDTGKLTRQALLTLFAQAHDDAE